MWRILLFSLLSFPLAAQQPATYKIAVIGLVHSHVWGHLHTMVEGKTARLVGVAESNPELVAEAKKSGVTDSLIYSDYLKMLDETKPDIVWAFVENNRHLEIARPVHPGISTSFLKNLSPAISKRRSRLARLPPGTTFGS